MSGLSEFPSVLTKPPPSANVEVITSEHLDASPEDKDKNGKRRWLFSGKKMLEGNHYFFEIRQGQTSFMTLACKSREERDGWVSVVQKLLNT